MHRSVETFKINNNKNFQNKNGCDVEKIYNKGFHEPCNKVRLNAVCVTCAEIAVMVTVPSSTTTVYRGVRKP